MTIINGTKGNNGRAARRNKTTNLEQKLLLTFACCAIFLLFRYVGRSEDLHTGMGRKAMMRLGELREAAAHQINNKKRNRGGGSGGRILPIRQAMTDPNFDTYAKFQAQQILSAQANLIDISIHSERMLEDDDYNGVTGKFCPLNFKVQKDNPPDSPMFRES